MRFLDTIHPAKRIPIEQKKGALLHFLRYKYSDFDLNKSFTEQFRSNNQKLLEVLRDLVQKQTTDDNGEYFSNQQEAEGHLIAIVGNDSGEHLSCTDTVTSRVDGDKRYIIIQEKEYEVIGIYKMAKTPIIPFNSLDDNTQLQGHIMIGFKKSITRSQYDVS